MVNNKANVLMTTEKDIEQLATEWANVPAWIKAHFPVKCLTYRYEGELLINGESLVFSGRDIKERQECEIELPLEGIIDVYFGFSHRLTTNIDPSFDISGPMPVAIHYEDNGISETLYFNASANNGLAHGNNFELYITLGKIVAKNRRVQLFNRRNRALVMA